MAEGFVRFMRRWYYWVFIALALVATLFTVFLPAVAFVIVLFIVALALFFAYQYYLYEVLKKERRPTPPPPKPMLRVEEVSGPVSKMPDIDEMAREAAKGPDQRPGGIGNGPCGAVPPPWGDALPHLLHRRQDR
jgi:hypothetical protein